MKLKDLDAKVSVFDPTKPKAIVRKFNGRHLEIKAHMSSSRSRSYCIDGKPVAKREARKLVEK